MKTNCPHTSSLLLLLLFPLSVHLSTMNRIFLICWVWGQTHTLGKICWEFTTQRQAGQARKRLCVKTASCRKSSVGACTHLITQNLPLGSSTNSYFTSQKTKRVPHLAAANTQHPPAGLKNINRHSPDEVSVKTANVWPPTVCIVNGCSRGADTVLSSIPSITVSSSFKVKDTCKEQCHPHWNFSAPFLTFELTAIILCQVQQ